MRRVLLIAALVAFGAAGVAYGATVVTNVYVITAKVKPKKSGTTTHPVTIGITASWSVSTNPKMQRPNSSRTQVVSIAGIRVNTNAFPTCSTSRLNNSKQGPTTCPKGSLVGTGFIISNVGPASNSSVLLTCRQDLSVYNGGGHSLSYYFYSNPAAPNHCPAAQAPPLAFAVHVKEAGKTLVETIHIPFSLRHPGNNTALDAAPSFATLTVPAKSRKIHGKTIGAVESIACPLNHRRHISIKFTLENGKSQTATANVPCT